MIKKFSLLILAFCVLSGTLLTSCKKEKVVANLIIKNWTLESKTVAGESIATVCEANSKWNFKADGTFTITDNCGEVKSGTWKLADDGSTITINNTITYQVVESSFSKLTIELQVADVGLVRWTFS